MQHLLGAFPYVDQYVPLWWRVMAPTKKRPPYPRGCDGADKPEHNLVHHCFASERRRHWASLQALGTIRCRPPAGRAVIGFLRALAAFGATRLIYPWASQAKPC
jgi:hypothetical protein